jgi:hypothetical protein
MAWACAYAQSASSFVSLTAGSGDVSYDSSSLQVHALGVQGSDRHGPWSNSLIRSFTPLSQPSAAAVPDLPAPGFYPADLSNPSGGPTVLSAQSHNVYVNCPAGNCWGTPSPAAFLTNLGQSTLIHVVDQYTGSTANNRYTSGTAATLTYPPFSLRGFSGTLGDSDILSIVHSAAVALGGGYQNIHHIFLPKGTDVCSGGFTQCYSPDRPSTFFFCAYHGSVTFSDVGHVLYSVEPFQDVPGCQVAPGSPNGSLIDSTASVLSHELIETITDPDGNAWWNHVTLPLFGAEIGDECQAIILINNNGFGNDGVVSLNGTTYAVQAEYSNAHHGCAYVPAPSGPQ